MIFIINYLYLVNSYINQFCIQKLISGVHVEYVAMHDHACILIWVTHTCMEHNIVPYAYGPIYAYGAEQL